MRWLATAVLAAALLAAPARALHACLVNGGSDGCTCSVIASRFVVDCSGLALEAIPTRIPAGTNSLLLTSNNIAALSGQPFSSLVNLTLLHLGSNLLSTIPNGALAGLANLNSLFLTGNPLTSVVPSAFQATPALAILYIDECILTAMPSLALPALTELDLSSNFISGLASVALSGLPTLRRLSLANNVLQTIDANAFQGLPLQQLNLNNNLLSTVSAQLLQGLVSLSVLTMEFNSLTSLSLLSPSLPALATALFGHNSIRTVDGATFASTPSIRYLALNDNQLQSVAQSSFTPLSALQQIYLGRNPWNCCGLEWLRTWGPVQDTFAVTCARPALQRGLVLQSTTGSITICTTDIPDAPIAPAVSAITPFSLQLTWPPAHGNAFDVDWYELEINSSSLPVWTRYNCSTGAVPPRIDGTPDTLQACKIMAVDYFGNRISPLTLTVQRLDPFTFYNFRLSAHTPLLGGTLSAAGASSAIVQTATYLPSKPPVCGVVPNRTSILVTISAPQPPNGVITSYVVRLYNAIGLEDRVVVTNETTLLLENLTAAANYSVTIQASTSFGLGPISDPANTTTLEDAPMQPDRPSLLNARSLGLTIGWAPLPRSRANGIITGYTVQITYPNSTQSTFSAGLVTSVNLTNLNPAQQYAIAISAATAAGSGPFGPPLVAQTLDAVPSQPVAPIVATVNSTCLQVNWAVPALPNGAIVRYVVSLTNTSAATNFSGSQLSNVFCDLLPARVYSFTVQAFTSLGGSNVSDTASGRTADAPANIALVTAYNSTQRSIVISWAEPQVFAGPILYFELYQVRKLRSLLYYTAVEDTAVYLLYSGNDTSTTLTGMDPATFYFHKVLAYTSAGSSNVSETSFTLTATAAPTRPGQPQVTVVNPSTVILQWTAPLVPNGNITQYGVFTQFSNTPILVVSGNTQMATISSLKDQTTYNFVIAAYTSAGMGEFSRASQVTTPRQNVSYTQTIVIVVVIAFVVVLSIGYAYERRRAAISRQAPVSEGPLEDGSRASVPATNPGKAETPPPSPGEQARQAALATSTATAQTAAGEPALPPGEVATVEPQEAVTSNATIPKPTTVSLRVRAQQLKLDTSSSDEEAPTQFV